MLHSIEGGDHANLASGHYLRKDWTLSRDTSSVAARDREC